MEYSELTEELRLFLNKAIEIYAIIKDKEIIKDVKEFLDEKKDYKFTKMDKKVLALFIAGMLVEGSLKNIFSQFDDIVLQDFLDFLSIKESDIKPLRQEEYEEFYDKDIKLDLINILGNSKKDYSIITPEVIVLELQYIRLYGSSILEYFGREYKEKLCTNGDFYNHPIFAALKNWMIYNRIIVSSNQQKIKSNNFSFVLKDPFQEKPEEKEDSPQTDENQGIIIDEKTWDLLEQIKTKFIGQEKAAEDLFYNIINNQHLAEQDNISDGERAIIFIDGPSGTGKTAIAREITDKLGIPFVRTSVTDYSTTGYVGGDLTDLLKELYKRSNGNLQLAQRGIIVFDEFDKIAYKKGHGLEMSKGIQHQLLHFMSDGKYIINTSDNIFRDSRIEFDTSKITFIALGALTDLRSQKTTVKRNPGFESPERIEPEDRCYTITPKDLESIGLDKELAGRFNTFLHTDDYSLEALEKILRESAISPMLGFKTWIETWNKQLFVDDAIYHLIAEKAYELNTGARGLQTIMNGIRTPFIREVLRGSEKNIYLNPEIVTAITNQTTTRKVRG